MDERLFGLLRHRPPMLLLDRVIGTGPGTAEAAVDITPDSPFYRAPDGVPAWIGIEYMAQTVGVMAGADAEREGRDLPLGYLLGTRSLDAELAWFGDGMSLRVTAEEVFVDGNGLGAYNCAIFLEDRQVSACRLTVFRRPQDSVHPA